VNGFLATYRRELRAYFFSPLAYIVLFFGVSILIGVVDSWRAG